ncbi:MAG: hypothetical protein QM536_05970 [Chitinophagaceae bacterium]|nr:hypothetical protein [Chitinophagaceae bacterium]
MIFKNKVSQGLLDIIQKKERKGSLRNVHHCHWDSNSRTKYFNTFYYAQLLSSSRSN